LTLKPRTIAKPRNDIVNESVAVIENEGKKELPSNKNLIRSLAR